MGGNRWNGLVVGQGTGRTYYVSHMVLRWAVGFPKTMVVRPALLLLLFYFLNSKRIRVSGFLENCRIRVSVSFRYRYAYPYPCNLDVYYSTKLSCAYVGQWDELEMEEDGA